MSRNASTLNSPPPQELPDIDFLLQGAFVRTGDHLLIQKESGDRLLLEDYFAQDVRPALQAPNGALLLAETVELLTQQTKPGTLVAGPSMHVDAPPNIGTSTKLVGHVTATGPDGVSRTLQEGSPVHPKDVIKTDKGASVLFKFVDGTEFQLSNQAQAVLDKYQFAPEEKQGAFEATVVRGIFRYQSGELAFQHPGQHSLIKTPTAMIGVRGSELSGEVAEDGSTTVVHSSGILDISDASGRETVTLLEPGTATSVTFGAASPAPIFRPTTPFLNHLKNNLDFDLIRDHGSEGRKEDGNKPQEKGGGSEGVSSSVGDKSHVADGKTDHAPEGSGVEKLSAGQNQLVTPGEAIKDPLSGKEKELSSLATNDLFLTSQAWTTTSENDLHADKGNAYSSWMAAGVQQDEVYRPRLTNSDSQTTSDTILPPTLPSKTGVFLDSPVGGVTYTSGSMTGVTTSSGGYAYKPGDIVVFKIGDIVLGSSQGQSYVTPVDLAPSKNSNTIVNILRLLQTLDSDGNPNNGIQISEQAQEAAKGVTVDINASIEEFGSNNQLISLVSNPELFDPGLPPKEGLLSAVEAMAHFKETLQELADLDEGQLTDLLEVLDEVDGALNASASEVSHDTLQANEDTPFSFTIQTLLANDRITSNVTLELMRITQPAHGVIEISSDGGLVYTPLSNYHGSDSFSYTIPDGIGGYVTAEVQIGVTAVNDAPISANKTLTLAEDGRLTLQASDFGFADIDDNTLSSVTITSLPGSGTLWRDANHDGTQNAGETLAQGATITAAQIADNELLFSPVADANGTGYAAIGFTVSDGLLASSASTLTVDVTPVNDAPISANKTLTLAEDGRLTLQTSDFGFADNDGNTLSSVTITSLPGSGTLWRDANHDGTQNAGETLAQGATITAAQIADNELLFSPVADANG
ncbi:MAG: tandem-95 repeat protein, partial [Magnetococcales bacterium]|nr:tandem-95 repeat protein [Magnetococcales bacterium]